MFLNPMVSKKYTKEKNKFVKQQEGTSLFSVILM